MSRIVLFGSLFVAFCPILESFAIEASWLGRPFVKVVDEATTVPGESHTFASFAPPLEPRFTLRDQTVHLVAPAGTVNFQPVRALLRYKAGLLETLVFTNTVAPDGTKFTDTFYPTDLQDGAINFTGYSQNGNVSALYELRDGVIKTAISKTDSVPGGGSFLGFGGTTRRGSRVVGGGQITGNHTGVFLLDGTNLSKIADDTTDLPGAVTGFGGIFGIGIFGFDGNRVTFATAGNEPNAPAGVFSYLVGGGFEKIADTKDFIPGEAGRFTGFGETDIEGGNLFFVGLNQALAHKLLARQLDGSIAPVAPSATAISAAGAKSVYYANGIAVFRWTDGYLETVIRSTDTIGGKRFQTVFGVSGKGDDVAVGVRFRDGTSGVYLAAGASPLSAPALFSDLPPSQTVSEGSNTRLSILATGGSLSYQWSKDNVDIPGATAPLLAFSSTARSDAGTYQVVVKNSEGQIASKQLVLTVTPATAPAIATPPASTRVALGGTASFTVAATGEPLSYQWRFKGQPLLNATSSSLQISGATAADLGEYSVVVSNPAGSQTSAAASLDLATAPSIVRDPMGGLVAPGDSFTFSVSAAGDGPFTYRWTKNGVLIGAATNASYTIPSVSTGDGGSYIVSVTTPYGQASGKTATLTVDAVGAKFPISTIRSAAPALENGRIVVPRDKSNSFGQLDMYEGGVFKTVADTNLTAVGASAPFKTFVSAEIDGGDIAFMATLANDSNGLFLISGGQTRRIVDSTVAMPGTAKTFGAVGSFSFSSGKIAFQATDSGSVGGIFIYDGSIQKIALSGERAPGGQTFANFGGVNSAGGVIVFWASLSSGGGGIFAFKNETLTKVVDFQSSTLPGLTPGFFGIASQAPSTDGTRASFTTFQANNVSTLWVSNLDGTSPAKVVETGQAAPGGGQFGGISNPIMDNGNLIFLARDQSLKAAIYYMTNSVITRIISETDNINGFAGTLKFSKDGYSNGRLAVGRTQFELIHDILLINVAALPILAPMPLVTQEPLDVTVNAGEGLQLTVAGNVPGLAFQWHKNNAPVEGATAPDFVVSSVTAGHAGDYFCVLTNSAGSVSSRTVHVTVNSVVNTPVALSVGLNVGGLPFIEFPSASGGSYHIQYAPSAGEPWKTAPSAVAGTGAVVRWIDNGPPETESHPSTTPARLYRVYRD